MKYFGCWLALVMGFCGAPGLASAQVVGGIVSQEEAIRHGLTRAWYVQTEVSSTSGEVVDTTLHDGTLFVQTSRARLQAIDVESGSVLWSIPLGKEGYPCSVPGASADFVAATNGSTLHVIERKTGREVWNRQLPSVPGTGPAISATHVFIPTVNGTMYGYHLTDRKAFPFLYKSFGRILVQPVITADSLAWTTEQGYLYFLSLKEPERLAVNFRLDTKDRIESRPGYWTPYLYSVSLDGYVYAVHEETGRIHWKFSTAEPLSQAPVAVNGKVYVCTSSNGMYCLNGDNGQEEWYAPGVSQFISVSPTRVYASDPLNRLVILDAKSGGQLDSFSLHGVTKKLRNVQSDRIFLTTAGGVVQCLRESDLQQPVVYVPPLLRPKKEGDKAKDKASEEAPAAAEPPSADEPPAAPSPFDGPPPAEEPDSPFGDAPADDPFG